MKSDYRYFKYLGAAYAAEVQEWLQQAHQAQALQVNHIQTFLRNRALNVNVKL